MKLTKLCAFLIAGAALIAGALQTQAQTYGTITLGNCPSTITASGSSNVNQVIDCRYNRHVGVAISGASKTSTSTLTVTFLTSLDASKWDGTGSVFALSIPNSSTATLVTNIDMTARGYLKCTTAVAGSNDATNCSVQVSLKPGQ